MTPSASLLDGTKAASPVRDNASQVQLDPLTTRTRTIWTSADFGYIAAGYAEGAAEFVGRLGLKPGVRVLDVAAGTGNLALPAARAGATVTGVDIASNLLAAARTLALAENLDIRFDEGNAEALPYADGAFDVVITMFGAMFAARPERVATELLRVVRAGGHIAMANWVPDGFVSQMLKAHAELLPPSPVPSPLLWGDPAVVRERLSLGASKLTMTQHTIAMAWPMSPAAVVELFRAHYGPTVQAFAALDTGSRARLHERLVQLWTEHNVATDGTTRVEAEYLEVRVDVR